ncbi:MAG: hypothetical protein BGO55_30825 [Sphingobacteriales bacterium 50-39]|nr:hypothetical protein [Sphingobacteriales bacterium]OJW60912.1 MAG: hypothetical protein BGO55_30825 [Sphingobacteriales bacterium 50-39]
MSDYKKTKAVFTYCFQVWMTAVMFGPVVYLIWYSKQFDGFTDWMGFEIIIGLYSIMYSIPGMLFFSGGAAFVFLRPWPIAAKRIVLSIWSSLLTIAAFGILFDRPITTKMDMFPGSICYCLPSILSIWIYRWPRRMK